jgi:hypothetical protein
MREDDYIVFVLLLSMGFIIALGMYVVNPGYADLTCAEVKQSYTVLESYNEYDYETVWEELYLQILDKLAINIPTNRPNYISYQLCSPCRYNITFLSDKVTNFFIFDEYNKERYFSGQSAFPLVKDVSSKNTTFSFELGEGDKYYFVFDRSAQGTNFNDPATGRLIINELKGSSQIVLTTKYRDIVTYRNVTVCE